MDTHWTPCTSVSSTLSVPSHPSSLRSACCAAPLCQISVPVRLYKFVVVHPRCCVELAQMGISEWTLHVVFVYSDAQLFC